MFGLFRRKRKIPAPLPERVNFVRRLTKLRCKYSPELTEAFYSIGVTTVDELEDGKVMELPEALILTVIEVYTLGKEREGLADDLIFRSLNQAFSATTGRFVPDMPPPYSLERYIRHFLEAMQPTAAPVDEEFIPIAIREVLAFYGR